MDYQKALDAVKVLDLESKYITSVKINFTWPNPTLTYEELVDPWRRTNEGKVKRNTVELKLEFPYEMS